VVVTSYEPCVRNWLQNYDFERNNWQWWSPQRRQQLRHSIGAWTEPGGREAVAVLSAVVRSLINGLHEPSIESGAGRHKCRREEEEGCETECEHLWFRWSVKSFWRESSL
jgi:hypothetical protein